METILDNCLDCGMVWSHSVWGELDFMSPFKAAFVAANLRLEILLQEGPSPLCHNWSDPRILPDRANPRRNESVEIPTAKHDLKAVACDQPGVERFDCATVGKRSGSPQWHCSRLYDRRIQASDGILKKGRACRSKLRVRFCEDCPEADERAAWKPNHVADFGTGHYGLHEGRGMMQCAPDLHIFERGGHEFSAPSARAEATDASCSQRGAHLGRSEASPIEMRLGGARQVSEVESNCNGAGEHWIKPAVSGSPREVVQDQVAVADRRRVLNLEACLPKGLAEGEITPREEGRAFHIGTTLDVMLATVEKLDLRAWRTDLQEVGVLHEASRAALQMLPTWDRSREVEQLRIYVDGSHFGENQTAWAAAGVGRVGARWFWVGFISGRVHTREHVACLGDGECNARTAELHAMSYALGAACALDCIDVEIVYDATSAAQIAQGLASSARHRQLARLTTSLSMVAEGKGVQLAYRHVRSHQGDAMNELADSIAKATACGKVQRFSFEGVLAAAERQGEVDWWWLTVARHGMLPPLADDGAMNLGVEKFRPEWSGQTSIPRVPIETLVSVGVDSDGGWADWDLRLITYNVNSLKHESTKQFLDRKFSRVGAQLVGLQESRCHVADRMRTLHYECFCSPCVDGSLGCQLWVKRNVAVATLHTGVQTCFDVNGAVVLVSRPRLLVVVIEGGGQKFACVVGHAPTSQASVDDIASWWDELQEAMRKLPRNEVPLMFLDANARFDAWESGGATQGVPKGRNAVELQQMLGEQEMDTCSCKDDQGRRVVTWVAPGGHEAMIDYIVMPRSLASLAKPFRAFLSPGVEFDAAVAEAVPTTDVDNCHEEGFAELRALLRSGSEKPTAQWIARTLAWAASNGVQHEGFLANKATAQTAIAELCCQLACANFRPGAYNQGRWMAVIHERIIAFRQAL